MPLRVNGEAFIVADSHVQRDATALSFEVEGRASAEVRWTEGDQADPAGRYRARLNGDALTFQRAASAEWAASTDLLTLRKDEIAFHVPIDLSSVHSFVGHIIDTVEADAVGEDDVAWLGEGYGPLQSPAGYLLMMVDDDISGGAEVYVPFWRKGG